MSYSETKYQCFILVFKIQHFKRDEQQNLIGSQRIITEFSGVYQWVVRLCRLCNAQGPPAIWGPTSNLRGPSNLGAGAPRNLRGPQQSGFWGGFWGPPAELCPMTHKNLATTLYRFRDPVCDFTHPGGPSPMSNRLNPMGLVSCEASSLWMR